MNFLEDIKCPSFLIFFEEDGISTVEHVGSISIQRGKAGANDFLKLRLFANSHIESTLTWYINLHPYSVFTWLDLENQFHA